MKGQQKGNGLSDNSLEQEKEQGLSLEEKHLVAIMRKQVSGPLPSAEEFQGYEFAVPGAGDRILKMAERQSEHRQRREMQELKIISRDSIWGLVFAFVFSLIAEIGAIVLIYTDHAIAGTVIGGTGLVAVVGAFIQGRNPRGSDSSM